MSALQNTLTVSDGSQSADQENVSALNPIMAGNSQLVRHPDAFVAESRQNVSPT
ncbi:MAG: hypothetical protein AAGG69_06075 [Pseudomonadota bacterium]